MRNQNFRGTFFTMAFGEGGAAQLGGEVYINLGLEWLRQKHR